MDISINTIIIVSLTGILMGAMGAIIGSTMLILVPLLSLLGLPIQTAIGTAKVSVISREIVPAMYFHKRNLVKFAIAVPFSIAAIITSFFSSMIAISLNPNVLEKIVAACMLLISAIILFSPNIGLKEKIIKVKALHVVGSIILGALVGFYVGIFGGGGNVFIIFGFVIIFGNTFLQATANSKVPNLLITAASIPMFMVNDFINWELAIPLMICTAIGARFGARLAVSKGSKFIRGLFVGLVLVFALKYII
jgi:uncharacterized membrane protein YfcA